MKALSRSMVRVIGDGLRGHESVKVKKGESRGKLGASYGMGYMDGQTILNIDGDLPVLYVSEIRDQKQMLAFEPEIVR
ncbi:hypothetical protein [Sulfidibacter corallicola]|uniref:Uncharacterized protein n=1 Tax=Sulfidibacter corallicola TaxID=2818388 RepID=A0A8A4TKF7_SULCO|nr:hypothetical protein [Sulfidibacter corallicola]QTD49622.1 hypothetical protein J3U87_28885 [Sulfidibacter corallicola]